MGKTVIKSFVLLSAILISCSSLKNNESASLNEQFNLEQSQESSSENGNQTSDLSNIDKESSDFSSSEVMSSNYFSSSSAIESSSSISCSSSNSDQSSESFKPLIIPDNTYYVRSGTVCLGILFSEEALLINDFESFCNLLNKIDYETSINTKIKRYDERINSFCNFIDGINKDFFIDKHLLFTMPMEVTYYIDDFKLQLVTSDDGALNLYYKYVHTELDYTFVPPSGYLFDAFAIKKEKPINELNVRVTSPDGSICGEYHQDFAKE